MALSRVKLVSEPVAPATKKISGLPKESHRSDLLIEKKLLVTIGTGLNKDPKLASDFWDKGKQQNF